MRSYELVVMVPRSGRSADPKELASWLVHVHTALIDILCIRSAVDFCNGTQLLTCFSAFWLAHMFAAPRSTSLAGYVSGNAIEAWSTFGHVTLHASRIAGNAC